MFGSRVAGPRFTSVLLVRRREQPSAAGADLGFDDGSHLLITGDRLLTCLLMGDPGVSTPLQIGSAFLQTSQVSASATAS